MDHHRRIGQLRRRITRAGLHGLLVTHLPDVRYLCGFTGSSAALAITRRAARLFTDGRYTAQAAEEVSGAKVQIVSSSPASDAVAVAGRAAGSRVRRIRSRRTPPLPIWRAARRAAVASAPHFSYSAGRPSR